MPSTTASPRTPEGSQPPTGFDSESVGKARTSRGTASNHPEQDQCPNDRATFSAIVEADRAPGAGEWQDNIWTDPEKQHWVKDIFCRLTEMSAGIGTLLDGDEYAICWS